MCLLTGVKRLYYGAISKVKSGVKVCLLTGVKRYYYGVIC